MSKQTSDYIRGGIWWINLSKYPQSAVQGGYRPVVIVSSQPGCRSSEVITVCPLTTKIKELSVNVSVKPLINGRPQQVLTNQIVTVPKDLLTSPSGCLDKEDMEKVELGIMISLGLVKSEKVVHRTNSKLLAEAEKDEKLLEELIPQAEVVLEKLKNILNRSTSSSTGRKYKKRSAEEVADFIKEWEDDRNNRNEVAKSFGFNSYGSAYNFWSNHKKRV